MLCLYKKYPSKNRTCLRESAVTYLKKLSFSDSSISQLEPEEHELFDVSLLNGITSGLLIQLMELAELAPGEQKRSKTEQNETDQMTSSKAEQVELEAKLDDDINRALNEELEDHNADKKRHSSQSSGEIDCGLAQIGASNSNGNTISRTHSNEETGGQLEDTVSTVTERIMEDLVDASLNVAENIQTNTDEEEGRESEEFTVENKKAVKSESCETQTIGSSQSKTSTLSRVHSDQKNLGKQKEEEKQFLLTLLKMQAMKTLASFLTCNQYLEMLLVPKSVAENKLLMQSTPTKVKSNLPVTDSSPMASSGTQYALNSPKQTRLPLDTQSSIDTSLSSSDSFIASKSDDVSLQEALRSVMKHLVNHAVAPSPMRPAVNLADLERAQNVLYKTAVTTNVHLNSNIQTLKGKLTFCLKIRFKILKSSLVT